MGMPKDFDSQIYLENYGKIKKLKKKKSRNEFIVILVC